MINQLDKEEEVYERIIDEAHQVGSLSVAGFKLANPKKLIIKADKKRAEAEGYDITKPKYALKIRKEAENLESAARTLSATIEWACNKHPESLAYFEDEEIMHIDPDYSKECHARAVNNFKNMYDPGPGFAIGGTSKLLWRPGDKEASYPALLYEFRSIMEIVKEYAEKGIIMLTSTPVLTKHESYFDLLKIMYEYIPETIKVTSTLYMSEEERRDFSGGDVFPERKYLHDSCCNFNTLMPLHFESLSLASYLESARAGNILRLTSMSYYRFCGCLPHVFALNIMAEYFGAVALAITVNPDAVCINGAMPAIINLDGTTNLDASNATNALIGRISDHAGVRTIQSGPYNNEISFENRAKLRAIEESIRSRRFHENIGGDQIIRFGFGHLTPNYMCEEKLKLDCENQVKFGKNKKEEKKPLFFPVIDDALEIITRVKGGNHSNDSGESGLRDVFAMENWTQRLQDVGYFS